MGQVLIRNLDDAILTDYRRAAKDHGRSLEAKLRDALALASDVEGMMLIREDRDGLRDA